MRSYSETDVFSQYQLDVLEAAERLVDAIQDPPVGADPWRCHEVARAVGVRLGLRCVDGKYGSVDHTWLVVGVGDVILDVYAVGSLPQVRLLDVRLWMLPHAKGYVAGAPRDDIRVDALKALAVFMNPVPIIGCVMSDGVPLCAVHRIPLQWSCCEMCGRERRGDREDDE